jgi:outer membrane protein assembly factor BamB
MNMTRTTNDHRPFQRLRLWPGAVLVSVQWFLWAVLPVVAPEAAMYGFLGGVALGLAVLIWWMFFSRVPHLERWGALAVAVAAAYATRQLLVHPSIQGGHMGMLVGIYIVPVICLALVLWAVIGRNLSRGAGRLALAGIVLLTCLGFALLRTDGITGDGRSQFAWRWSKTAEQQLLEGGVDAPLPAVPPAVPAPKPAPEPAPTAVAAPVSAVPAVAVSPKLPADSTAVEAGEWPGFRGPQRNAVVSGVRIKTDWSTSPPVELWRRPVGPGWSSFAMGEGLLYTQEQRGDFEVVACYSAATGEPVWAHRDAVRFWESNGGAGPRGTPALHHGRVYAMGATGILNALDASSGRLIWSRNAASETGAKLPGWGFSGSPLVVDDLVIVAASGRLAAYESASGNPRWVRREGGGSYSSPHLVNVDGVVQVVLMSSVGITSVAPGDGSVLWQHLWEGSTIVQPAMMGDGTLLITTGDASGGLGTRRLSVKQGAPGWSVEEMWTTRGLKPYFNDFVVNGRYAFGFDGSILACIHLEDGNRAWKGGRYGHGQMLLLKDQDLLLVLSEEGELALVRAAPDQFTEVARVPALEGKTWNHPMMVGSLLVVRNGQEMVAFRLPVEGG